MAARAHPVDVVVVGGGIVGAAAAAEAALRGARVHLVERTAIAAGASGRNSGAVWQPADQVLDTLYRESLDRYRALGDEAEAAGVPFALADRPAGILTLGRDPDPVRRTVAAWQRTHPWLAATYLDEHAVRELEPAIAPGVVACRLDIGYPVRPSSATEAFAAVARVRGATISEGAVATLLLVGDRVVGVEAGGERIEAGAVIVAAGPWTPGIVDPSGGWQPIRPFWGVVVDLELAAPPGHVLEGSGIEEAIDPDVLRAARHPDADEGIVDFSLVTAAGRSALGSTFLPVEPDPAAYVERLVAGGAAWVPAIAGAPVLGVRACARPLALDGRPLVGQLPGRSGLVVAAGHGPWGISTGPASGAHAAAVALGDPEGVPEEIRAAVDPGRFALPG